MGADLRVLREILANHGFDVLVPSDLAAGGRPWVGLLRDTISQSELVVALLAPETALQNVYFELGLAHGLGKRVLLVVPPGPTPIPFDLASLLTVRTTLDNHEAIGFVLEQIANAPSEPQSSLSIQPAPDTPLGNAAHDWLARHHEALARGSHALRLEEFVRDLLKAAGASVVSESTSFGLGVDLAVWSDVLEPYVGNPLAIEVKRALRSRRQTAEACARLSEDVARSGASWGLLLYFEGSETFPRYQLPPNVLLSSVRSLIEALENRSFPEFVRDLRNERVHGLSS